MRRVVLPTPPLPNDGGGSGPRRGLRGATYLSLRHSSGRRVRVSREERASGGGGRGRAAGLARWRREAGEGRGGERGGAAGLAAGSLRWLPTPLI